MTSQMSEMVNNDTYDISHGKADYSSLSGLGGDKTSDLSQPEKQIDGSNKNTITYKPKLGNAPADIDWQAFDAITDEQIDQAMAEDPDTFEPTDAQWNQAIVGVRIPTKITHPA